MAGAAAGRRALGGLAASVAAAGTLSGGDEAECRARPPDEGSLILEAEENESLVSRNPVVCDGTSSWHLIDNTDVAEASKIMDEALGISATEAGARTLDLAARMAAKPSVRAALAEELGLATPAIETVDIHAMIAKLTQENDDLRAQAASARALLDDRERQHRAESLLVQQLEQQNQALADSYDILSDVSCPSLSEDATRAVATGHPPGDEIEDETAAGRGNPGDKEEDLLEDLVEHESDGDLAERLQAEEIAAATARDSQETADAAFARYLSGLDDRDDDDDDDDKPKSTHADAPGKKKSSPAGSGTKTKTKPEDESPSLIEISLALAGIILLIAMTRRFSPALAKKAVALSSAALAGIVAAFKCSK